MINPNQTRLCRDWASDKLLIQAKKGGKNEQLKEINHVRRGSHRR
jgi:hypothetical protein